MKKAKNIFKFAIAIILLIIIPLIPLTVSKFQDKKLIDHLQVEKVKNDSSSNVQTSELNIPEKLALIADFNNKEKNIITTTRVRDMSDENITGIREIINEQLTVLKSLGILNDFIFNESYICYNYILKQYSNAVEPGNNVSVYEVSFSSKKGFFTVWIDADTNKIYQYDYYNQNYKTKNDKTVFIFGTKYLGLSEEEIYKYLYEVVEDSNYLSGISENKIDSVRVVSCN